MIHQGQDFEVIVRLMSGGSPVLGVVVGNVTMNIWKTGMGDFVIRPISPLEWTELSNGYYTIKFNSDDSNTLGVFFFTLSGSFDLFTKELSIDPAQINQVLVDDVCIVFGNIVDIGGNPESRTPVYFRPVAGPHVVSTSLINSAPINMSPDAYGNFSVRLLRNQTVVVSIPGAGINNQIVVPDQSTALLLDLLPPIT